MPYSKEPDENVKSALPDEAGHTVFDIQLDARRSRIQAPEVSSCGLEHECTSDPQSYTLWLTSYSQLQLIDHWTQENDGFKQQQ